MSRQIINGSLHGDGGVGARCVCGSVCVKCSPTAVEMQQARGGATVARHGGMRILRSWSSSEHSAGSDGETRRVGSERRSSVAGPMGSAGSLTGSRTSHTPRSLHTWAEEDDEEGAGIVQNVAQATQAGSTSSSGRSTQHAATNSSGSSRHTRLRTPYSLSIPSLVGSPQSFTQPFLASRTSVYARHPPSSQLRAAHIDWDRLSLDEIAAWSAAKPALHAASRPHVFARPPQQQQQQQQQHLQETAMRPAHGMATTIPQHYVPLAAATNLRASRPEIVSGPVLTDEWSRQAVWNYACRHHPLLASFSAPSALHLSVRWRWGLLCLIATAALCVLIGTPIALTVLLPREAAALAIVESSS
ncbi:hypothetical protein COEREDRAFT_13038 [Coemansia reversa NRRL 1564]|uniref:Uncharacterized protein n=1 Tax=Coemansia reversa (strain ATCC 12441 / NRRL 1564) TaxID=763665 RepID=A0A2G5BL21_COERN|nr:hypothetical protein COEREDRAFT_13038 [Coemansia reversa NRRL 1564]|eukprot:PIA19714.1 hypothetical protein COEREDRAFT_13038 [Coemansia reversa NRRL 1564]